MANVKLASKAVGDIVKLNVGGVAKEFIVAHKGVPGAMYDGSCSGVWLLMKDIYERRQWHSSNNDRYESSDIHSYLNNTFLNLFDSNIKEAIKRVKIPYRKNGGSGGTNLSGANGLSCKVFLLSGYEVGLTSSDKEYLPQDGAKLSYFESGIGTSANNKRVAYYNGSAALWWLRSPATVETYYAWDVQPDGSCEYLATSTYSLGIRPALILPYSMEVDDSGNVVPATQPMKLGELPVGGMVSINVNGAAKDFLVVHQGKPSSLYDDSCDGTWLLMNDIYETRQWHSSSTNYLEYSTIHSYLNSTFLNLFESNIRDAIKQVKIPYRKNGGGGGADQSGANGLPAKIFLLSGYEVGWTTSDNQNFPVDGAKLSYFEAGTGTSANNKRVANLDGSVFFWWLRSPYASGNVWRVSPNGLYDSSNASYSNGIRPALVLPQDMEVDSSGNVTPPPPATHKTLVNGTVYTVQGGKCMVDGTVYNILKGRTLIGGTGYDIVLPSAGIKIETLDVGQSVFTNIGGVKKEFLVVHQGLPSSLYDSSCDGTWLLMKDIYENRQWESSDYNIYETSTVNTYLNGPFFSQFDSNIQGIIKQIKIPYRKNGGNGGPDQSGANGLSCKVFLLSCYEVGYMNHYSSDFPVEGAKLDYFESENGTSSRSKRIAKLNGSDTDWWLRSPCLNYNDLVFRIYSDGQAGSGRMSYPYGIRPCIILPSDALVNDEFKLIS